MTNWQTKKLGDISEITKGKGLSKDDIVEEGKYTCIHYGELFTKYSEVIKKVRSQTNLSEGVYLSRAGDVLMPTSDVTPRGLATASYLPFDNVVIGGDVLVIRPCENELDGRFLAYYVAGDKRAILRLTTGSTIFHLYGSDMRKLKLDLPEKPEQGRIVSVLEVWDEYIEKLEQKIALKEQLRKGLMQQLLTGKRRLPGFKSHWTTLEFEDVFKVMSKYPGYKSVDYSSQGQYPIYDQSYDKHVSGYVDEQDKVIVSDQPLTLFGDHSRVVKYIDSKSFVVGNDGIKLFKAQNNIDDYYAYLLLKSYRVPSTGYNRHFKYIADATFDIPELTEQRQISNVIKIADDEIGALLGKLTEVKLQKKYLLKNLITGTVRVPENLGTKRDWSE